ncbi:hypothetical protein [Phaeobacter sp. NW0010-22]|uniref:hypothetical protein n=1 Tax=Phaeobacter sp. NW0010-22 TaxID=3135907 RepID=UPI00310619F0
MSAHSPKSKGRHPKPKTFERVSFRVGHVLFEVCDHPQNGATFALIAGEATEAKFKRPLFTGFVQRGMGTQLRRLAHHFDDLEARLPLDPDISKEG